MIPDCECWLWGGHINAWHGYGEYVPTRGTRWRAHRLSFFLHHGPLKEGLVVMHSCDNRWCVNPAHLSQGTLLDNGRDCVAKGRHAGQRQTRCRRGHEFTPENIYQAPAWRGRGSSRACRACRKQHRLERMARQATAR
jgi:hypothetical protein